MREKFTVPHADAVVGKAPLNPEYVKSDFEEFLDADGNPVTDPEEVLRRIFSAGASKFYEEFEQPKTEKDLQLISNAESAVREYASLYGRTSFSEFSLDHVHLFKEGGVEDFTGGRLSGGSHSTVMGEIIIERRDDLDTAITAFHELWHMLGSYSAIQVTKGDKTKLHEYRAGFSIQSRDGKNEWFHYTDEALTGYVTKRYVNEKLKGSPELGAEIEKREQNNIPIDTTRERELTDLLRVVQKLYESNRGKFSGPTEIIDMFVRAQVTGNVLPIARLVEKTFGKGSFRHLGDF